MVNLIDCMARKQITALGEDLGRRLNRRQYMGIGIGITAAALGAGVTMQHGTGAEEPGTVFVTDFSEYAP